MLKKLAFPDAVGLELGHDITEIRPGEFKGPAFKKGHLIRECDCAHFKRLGKEHVYQVEVEADEYHENDAAELMARALAGPGVSWFEPPHEGKVSLRAKRDGLLKVQVEALAGFNMLPEVMCATRHSNTLVHKGEILAGTRAIPLVVKKKVVDEACAIAQRAGGILSVLPLRTAAVGLVITGNEVFHGVIEDRFEPILREKVTDLGSTVVSVLFAPDDPEAIAAKITESVDSGADLIITSGGMSVDPDDVTCEGIRKSGVDHILYGSSVLPGAMFVVARRKQTPILGTPACGLYHRVTILDLILPRVLAGEEITQKDIALLGHGGMCLNCPECIYPRCAFGKGV